LIEVMIALVITLIAVGVLSGGIASALRAAHDTARWTRAMSRAESHLAALTAPGMSMGEREGEEADGYRWRTRVAFVTSASGPGTGRPGPWTRGTGLYAVSVTISWQDGGHEQHFVLNSVRLGPVPGAPP
jgi:general secretion pathway protein I